MLTQKLLSISFMGAEWVLYLLILFSVISWAIMIERFYYLKKKRGNHAFLGDKIEEVIEQRNWDNLLDILKEDASSAATIASRVITHAAQKGIDSEEYMAVLLTEEKLLLESRIAFLGTIVSIAPFLGLLGTVLGIINAFHALSLNKQGGEMVMAGISEALVATALGLFIAIPAAAAYNYFVRMIKKIIISSENFTRVVLMHLLTAAEDGK